MEVWGTMNIHDAISRYALEEVKELLRQNPALLCDTDRYGDTPLHTAAYHRRDGEGIVKLLLARGAASMRGTITAKRL